MQLCLLSAINPPFKLCATVKFLSKIIFLLSVKFMFLLLETKDQEAQTYGGFSRP